MFTSRRIATTGGDKFRDEFSVDFDGSNDYIDTNFIPDYIHTNATMGMWIKMGDFTGQQMMGHHGGKRWYVGFNGTKATIGVQNQNNVDSGITLSPTPESGEWLHYVVTAIDGTATVYINSVAQGTLSYTQNSGNNPDESFWIGLRNNDGTGETAMNCKISELFQYDKGLTASEVKTLYNGREPYNHKEGICSSNLKAWWRMGDGTFDFKHSTDTDEGIICDMAQDVGLGPDILGGKGDMSDESYWTKSGAGSAKIVFEDGVCKYTPSDNGTDNMHIQKSDVLTVGKVYRWDVDITQLGSNTRLLVDDGNPYVNWGDTAGETGSFTVYVRASQAHVKVFRWKSGNDTDEEAYFDNLVVREVTGGTTHGIMKSMLAQDIESGGAS